MMKSDYFSQIQINYFDNNTLKINRFYEEYFPLVIEKPQIAPKFVLNN